MVSLYNNGKPRHEIIKEYDLTASAFSGWFKRFNHSGSFNIQDNRSEEEKEQIKFRKENQ